MGNFFNNGPKFSKLIVRVRIYNINYTIKYFKYKCHNTHLTCMWENKSYFLKLLLAQARTFIYVLGTGTRVTELPPPF